MEILFFFVLLFLASFIGINTLALLVFLVGVLWLLHCFLAIDIAEKQKSEPEEEKKNPNE